MKFRTTLTHSVFVVVLAMLTSRGVSYRTPPSDEQPPSPALQFKLADAVVTPSPRLGLAFPLNDSSSYEALADAGFGKIRISASWNLIQPTATNWNWSGLDGRIAAMTANGIEPLLTFYSDAAWATSPGDNDAKNLMPDDVTTWSVFVGAVSARYGDVVKNYQVANEFEGIDNRSGGWSSTPENLVAYVDAAYAAVKANDAVSTVIIGGVASFTADIALVNLERADFAPSQALSPTTSMSYTVEDARSPEMDALVESRLIRPLSEATYDAVSVHLYGNRNRDDARIELVRDLSGRRPVISTESGAPTWTGLAPTDLDYFTGAVFGNLNALAAGAEAVFWFLDHDTGAAFYNQHVALRDAAGDPKPTMWGIKLIAAYLTSEATVDELAPNVFTVKNAVRGDAIFGFWSDIVRVGALDTLSVPQLWVLDDPRTGNFQRLKADETPSPEAFVVADEGGFAPAGISSR